MALPPGTKFNGYEVLALIGAGGMGEVYRARDSSLKREIAIKVLPVFVSQDPDRLRRFEQEAQAAAALNHPNILSVYQFGLLNGAPYLVSELLIGENLREHLNRGPLPARKAIDFAIQCAHGLAAAHDKHIVHRDLKPENLFVTREGRLKILDFGLAKLTQPQPESDGAGPTQTHGTEPGTVMGTAGYMSPEQVRGADTDQRTDIFAFGAILYEMLTGRRAFQRGTSAETMTDILRDDPLVVSQAVQSVPPGLQRVARRCLEKNREQRFQSAFDLAFALEALSESGISVDAHITVPPARSRWKAISWASALLTLAVLLAAVTYFFFGKKQRIPFEHYSVEKIIDSDHLIDVAISPDGNYLAAIVVGANGAQSLILHHIPTGSERAILEDAKNRYYYITFSPDGNYLYFLLDKPNEADDLFRVPVLGGQATRIIKGIDTTISFIDGGSRICFYRENQSAGNYEFLSVSAEGGEETLLARKQKPFPGFVTVCSPDGKSALTDMPNFQSGTELHRLDFASGQMPLLRSFPLYLSWIHWHSTGDGFFASGVGYSSPAQLIYVTYPKLEMHPITNDALGLGAHSLSANEKTMVALQYDAHERFAELSIASPASINERDSGSVENFVWLDDHKVIESVQYQDLKIADLISDGTTPIASGLQIHVDNASLCGMDIIVASGWPRNGGPVSTYQLHLDGSGLKKLTGGPVDVSPHCTADGKWLFYVDGHHIQDPTVMRLPLQTGSGDKPANVGSATSYDVSPDGKSVVLMNQTNEGPTLHILATDTLKLMQSLVPPKDIDGDVTFSADSRSLFFSTAKAGDSTIWRQPLDAKSPIQVASIRKKSIGAIQQSPDGTRLGLVVSSPTSRAFLIRETR
jgi:serine/threonine protein kinase/Tol biopolymer transport system component